MEIQVAKKFQPRQKLASFPANPRPLNGEKFLAPEPIPQPVLFHHPPLPHELLLIGGMVILQPLNCSTAESGELSYGISFFALPQEMQKAVLKMRRHQPAQP